MNHWKFLSRTGTVKIPAKVGEKLDLRLSQTFFSMRAFSAGNGDGIKRFVQNGIKEHQRIFGPMERFE
jgi:hypothetical protein